MTNCKKCNAQILFIQMETGGIMPCDATPHKFLPDPSKRETFIVCEQSGDTKLGKIKRGYKTEKGVLLGYTPHWATCPEALNFKKKEVR